MLQVTWCSVVCVCGQVQIQTNRQAASQIDKKAGSRVTVRDARAHTHTWTCTCMHKQKVWHTHTYTLLDSHRIVTLLARETSRERERGKKTHHTRIGARVHSHSCCTVQYLAKRLKRSARSRLKLHYTAHLSVGRLDMHVRSWIKDWIQNLRATKNISMLTGETTSQISSWNWANGSATQCRYDLYIPVLETFGVLTALFVCLMLSHSNPGTSKEDLNYCSCAASLRHDEHLHKQSASCQEPHVDMTHHSTVQTISNNLHW